LRLEALEDRTLLSVVTWTNPGDGNWALAANWTDDQGMHRLPGPADDAVINTAGITVTHSSGADSIKSLTTGTNTLTLSGGTLSIASDSEIGNLLTLTGGTLDGAGKVTVDKALNWSDGTMSGAGTTAIAAGATATLSRGLSLSQRTLSNGGTATTQNAVIHFTNQSVINNQQGATFEVQAGTNFGIGIDQGTFNNAGLLRKTSSDTTGFGQVAFNNSGTVNVQAGTLGAGSGGTGSGSFTVAAGASLNLSGYNLTATSSVTGAGSVGLFNCTVAGRYNLTGSGGSSLGNIYGGVTFTATSVVGSLGGSLTVDGYFSDVTFNTAVGGVGGPVTVGGLAVRLIFQSSVGAIDGAISVADEADFGGPVGHVGSTITVGGTLNFSGGSAISTANLNLTGTLTGSDSVTVTGKLDWEAGAMTGTGTTTIAAGATAILTSGGGSGLNLSQRTLTNAGTATLTGNGIGGSNATINNLTGAIFEAQTGASATFNNSGSCRKTGGGTGGFSTCNNSGTVAVQAGTFSLGGGTSSGSFTVDSGATLNMSGYNLTVTSSVTGAGSVGLFNCTVAGRYNLTGSGGSSLGNIYGGVTFTATSVVGSLGGSLTVDGYGSDVTFTTAVGGVGGPVTAGGFAVRLIFQSSVGAIDGAISVADEADFLGTVGRVGGPISAAGTINFLGVVGFMGNAITINGGTLNFSGGSVITTNTLTLNGGTLTGRDAVTVTGRLDWPGGVMSGTGTLTVAAGATLNMVNSVLGDSLQRPLTNAGMATLQGQSLNVGSGVVFTNQGTFNVQQAASISGGTGSQFINTGTFNKSGGDTTNLTMPFTNSGTVDVVSGTLSLPSLTNASGTTLTGGTYVVTGTLKINIDKVQTNAAAIVLDGTAAQIVNQSNANALDNFSTNAATGSFTVQNGQTFTAPASFTNAGNLILGPAGTFNASGDYVQSSTGTLTEEIGGTPPSGQFGGLNAVRSTTLAGTFDVGLVNGFGAAAGQIFPTMKFASHTGSFATLEGLSLGRTKVFDTDLTATTFSVLTVNSAADLAVVGITSPSSEVAGQNLTISYTVKNQTTVAAQGSWDDSVYLSTTTTLTPDSVLLGRVRHTGPVAGGGTYTETLTAPIQGIVAGKFLVVVLVDSKGLVPDSDRSNNTRSATNTLTVSVPALTLGVQRMGTIANGQDVYFQVDVPPATAVPLTADFPAADVADVYVRYGQAPDGSHYDQASSTPPGAHSTFLLTGPAGTYYLWLHGREAAGTGRPFIVLGRTAGFELRSVTPDHGSNEGQVTMTIQGSLFSPTTTASLVSSSGQEVSAKVVRFEGDSTLLATFDLLRLAPGPYGVLVKDTRNGASSVLKGAFTVNSTAPGQIKFELGGPPAIRPFQTGTYIVLKYTNTGDTNLPALLVTLQAQNALFGNPIQNGYPQASLGIVFGPAAFVSGGGGGGGGGGATFPGILFRPQGTPSVELLANDPASAGGVLPPGYQGFFSIPFTPTVFGAHVTSTFSLLVPPDGTTPIDWSTQKDALRPPSIPADAWDAIFTNFLTRVGTTVGQYQQVLQDDATYLSQIGGGFSQIGGGFLRSNAIVAQPTFDAARLLAFELQQDGDSLPQPTLASAVDASAPAPGLPLTFGRVFVQPITGRYQLGAFGRGWADTWDTTAGADSSGNVTIQGAGTVRFFTKQPGGTYLASPRDHGTLTLQNGAYQLREKDGTLDVFQSDGRLGYVQDPNGNRIKATYSNGLLTNLAHSDGQSFTLTYNAQGRISQLTDEAGRITSYLYDPSGEHLMSVTGPGGTTHYAYDAGTNIDRKHALLSIANPDGTHLFFDYDDQGRLIGQHKDGGAEAITYVYDVGPGGFRTIDATGASTTSLLNDAGQTAQIIDPLGRVTRFGYDANFNLVTVVAATGITSTYQYDSQGNVIQQVDPLGNTVQMTYDPTLNRLLSLRDPRGNTMGYSYDAQGNLRSIIYPNGSAEKFSYDPMGNLTETVNRRNDAIRYTRDARGLLKRKDYADGSHIDFTYDDRGNLHTATDASGTTTLDWDPVADRLLKITYPGGRFLQFFYDRGGDVRTRMVDQSGFTVKYSYYDYGNLKELRDGQDNLIVHYDYFPNGLLRRKDMGNGTFTTYEYDAAGQLLHLVNHAPDGSVNSRFDYTYDDLSRRTSMTTVDGTTKYGYDADAQLTSVALPGGRTIQYVYDAAGNRVSVTDNGVTTNYTTNNLNEYTTVGTAQLAYDADGNLISQVDGSNSTIYTYDDENHLVSAVTPQGTWIYHYDPFGNRSATTHNGQTTRYLLDPAGLVNLVGEYDGSANLVAHYVQGLGLTSRVDATGASAYYDFDAIGSAVGLTGSTGSYVNTYSYLPFGERLSATEAIANSFTFVAQWGVMNEGTGQVFMRARDYTPSTARFTQIDPLRLVDANHIYQYAMNNPISLNDPLGLAPNNQKDRQLDMQEWLKVQEQQGFRTYDRDLQNLDKATHWELERIDINDQKWQLVLGFVRDVDLEILKHTIFEIFELPEDIRLVIDLLHSAWEFREQFAKLSIPILPFPALVGYLVIQQLLPGDPNDITGPAGFGPNGFIPTTQTLPYTIQFENKPDATAPAQVVKATQKLDPNLDWSTFQLGDFGFGGLDVQVPLGRNSYSTRLDLRKALGLFVDVTAGIDLNTGVATWTFTSIDPRTLDVPSDILSGFLPPDQHPPEGEAFINYTIQPKATAATGTRINAKATVIFDAGLPDQSSLDTAPIFNTIDAGPPTSSINPLPATSSPTFTVTWSGQDDPGGSGVASFDVFVSDNGGPFTPFILNVPQTSAVFTGQAGHTYAFYSVATDNVGNREATPSAAQASTRVTNVTPGFSYDPATKVLTISGTAPANVFGFQQATTADGAGLHTTYTFTLNGTVQSFADTQLSGVVVTAQGAGNTANMVTNDSYLGTDGLRHETGEWVEIGDGFALVQKIDAAGNVIPFLQLGGFTTIYATLGHDDPGVIVGTPGITNTFVSAGGYSYMNSGSAFYVMIGAKYVYAYSAGPSDVAYHYDGSGPSAYLVSGTAYSFMMGTDQGQAFFNEAVGFHANHAFARHSGDTAIFYDSPANDTFVGKRGICTMTSYNQDGSLAEYDSATGFAEVFAYSFVGGRDTASSEDPAHIHVSGFIRKSARNA
jgi:RHS repeat-associated protein